MHCRRGISEIIGSLIIVLIVTVAGVAVYGYSLNALTASGDSFNHKTQQYSEQAQERFEVLRVWSSGQRLNVTLLNYGETDLQVAAVYVNGTAVQQYHSGTGATALKNQLLTVDFNSPIQIPSSASLEILVVSARGGKDTAVYKT